MSNKHGRRLPDAIRKNLGIIVTGLIVAICGGLAVVLIGLYLEYLTDIFQKQPDMLSPTMIPITKTRLDLTAGTPTSSVFPVTAPSRFMVEVTPQNLIQANEGLKVRSGPGNQYPQVTVLAKGSQLEVYGKAEDTFFYMVPCPISATSVDCWVTGGLNPDGTPYSTITNEESVPIIIVTKMSDTPAIVSDSWLKCDDQFELKERSFKWIGNIGGFCDISLDQDQFVVGTADLFGESINVDESTQRSIPCVSFALIGPVRTIIAIDKSGGGDLYLTKEHEIADELRKKHIELDNHSQCNMRVRKYQNFICTEDGCSYSEVKNP